MRGERVLNAMDFSSRGTTGKALCSLCIFPKDLRALCKYLISQSSTPFGAVRNINAS